MTEDATVVRPGEGRVFSLGDDVARVLVPSGAADFSVFVSTVGLRGVPLHRHHRADEAFYVLEGVLDVVVGDRTERCTAGTFVFVPRGTVHAVRVIGTEPGKVLVAYLPGGMEESLEEFAQAPREERDRIARRYNSEFV